MEPQFPDIENILNEVESGNMRNVNQLCKLVKHNDPWLQTLDDHAAFKVSLLFNKIIESKIINLKFRLEFAIIICETLNKCRVFPSLIRFQASITMVSELVLELVLNCEEKMKYVKTSINLLNLFKISVTKKVIPINSTIERLLQRLTSIALSKEVSQDLKVVCMLILVAVANHLSCNINVVNLILNEIQSECNEILKFKINVDNQNIHFVSYFLLTLIQNLLSDNFKSANAATYLIFNSIMRKCKEVENFNSYSVLFEKIFNDMLTMSNSLLWPVTGLIVRTIWTCFSETYNFSRPINDTKYNIFEVNQFIRLAIKATQNYVQYKESELKFRDIIPLEHWVGGLKEIILCIITNMPKKEAYGDVVKAYRNVWPDKLGEEEYFVNFPDKTPIHAQAAKYLLEFRNNEISKVVIYITGICNNKIKRVKTTGVKGLCDLIEIYPKFLGYDLIQTALLDNYEMICATGRDKFAQAITRYVEKLPQKLYDNEKVLISLLKDPSMSVSRSTLRGITTLFTKIPIIKSELLFSEVIQLFSSSEEQIKKSAYTFFTSVCLESKHLDLLIKMCDTGHYAIITDLFEHAKSNDSVKTQEKLIKVTDSLVSYFKTTNASILLATAKLLLIISKIFPKSIVPHIPLLSEQLFSSSETQVNFKHVICKMLTTLGCDVKKTGLKIEEKVTKALSLLKMLPSYCYIEFIKLLLVVSDNPEKITNNLFKASYKILENVYAKRRKYTIQEINSSICLVLTLRQDYSKDEATLTIIHYLLRTPQFSSIVLSALSEIRKMFIPVEQEPRLVKILIEFLNGPNAQLVHDALYYLQCLIKGSNKIRHISNIKNIGDPTNEYVSYNIQECLEQVKKHCLSPNNFIRKAAWKVFVSILQSGLILFPRVLPTLVATSTDIDEDIRKASLDQLDMSKHWDLSGSCIQSLNLCYELAKNLHSNSLTRGFDSDSFELTCAGWLKLFLKSNTKTKSFIGNLLTEIEKTPDLNFAVYLLDVLVYMPLTSTEIVEHVFELFSKTISNLPKDVHEKKVCFLIKAEEYFDSLYKLSRKSDTTSPNNKNVIQRKGEVRDYLPHLDSRMSEIKLEEDHSEMNCSLAELQRKLLKPCSVALVRIDNTQVGDKNKNDNGEAKQKPVKLVIKRKIVNGTNGNEVEYKRKRKFEYSLRMDVSGTSSDGIDNTTTTVELPENENISQDSNNDEVDKKIEVETSDKIITIISNYSVDESYYPIIQNNVTIKTEKASTSSYN